MITRVWGKADSFHIELTPHNDKWIVKVPPDTSDGKYAVELFAMNNDGKIGVWTGFLYMSGGVCVHLELQVLKTETDLNTLDVVNLQAPLDTLLMDHSLKVNNLPGSMKITEKVVCRHG